MNKPVAFVRFTLLALLASTLACTQTDSLGSGGRDDDAGAGASDAPAPSPGGSGGTSGLDAGTAGAPGTGGGAGSGNAGVTGATSQTTATTGGQSGTTTLNGGATGGTSRVGGASTVGGASGGAGGSGGTTTPMDAGVDAPAGDAGPGLPCNVPNPAQVTCISHKDQCVPSSCQCLTNGTWACTQDCRGGLPGCDAGVSPDVSDGAVDGAAGCSVTTATLTVAPGSPIDSYCFYGCGLPLKLFKDGNAVELVDFARPECGTCIQPPVPACLPSGFAVKDTSYSLSKRYVVAGKCGSKDCSTTTCLEPGRYKVVYYVLAKQADGTCGGTPIELAAEFDYPQTSKVELRFSTLATCTRNADCSTGNVCFHGVSSKTCAPASDMCTSREPNFNRCMCPGCTCSGTDNADGFWGCVI